MRKIDVDLSGGARLFHMLFFADEKYADYIVEQERIGVFYRDMVAAAGLFALFFDDKILSRLLVAFEFNDISLHLKGSAGLAIDRAVRKEELKGSVFREIKTGDHFVLSEIVLAENGMWGHGVLFWGQISILYSKSLPMNESYLPSARKQFEYYQQLAEKTFEQVPDEKLFWQYNSESNSIATIVKHLWGNMLSRWTDFLTTDGEKEWRQRDAEFENDIRSREELLHKWNEGWRCLYAALDSLKPDDLERIVYIRNQGHTVLEAINRQLAHYPHHVGQIVFLGKMILDDQWVSLSIPRNGSKEYNAEKFAQPKARKHFTDDYNKGKLEKP
jgi:hypothetical protein